MVKKKKTTASSSKNIKGKSKAKNYKILYEEITDKNIRLLAEFDNYRKRTIKEKEDSYKYEGEKIIKNFLIMFDDFDRILNVKEVKNNKAIYDGLFLLYDKFNSILSDNGVLAYESIGENFNPELHEAIMMKKSKKKKNIVLQEYEKGFKYHDKVIRHAKVIVSE